MALILKARLGHDLDELRRDLDSVELGLGKLVGDVGKRKLGPLVRDVKALMPFDPTHRGWKGEHKAPDPGHVRDSISGTATRARFSVVTTHPGGPVHWWGGTISPRRAAITIHGRPGGGDEFIDRTAEEVVAEIDKALDDLLRRHGL